MLILGASLAGAFLAYLAFVFLYLHRLELPQQAQSANPAPRPGIWFCAHRALRSVPFQHMYLKLTPKDPSWAERYPLIFCRRDSMGAPFCTLGAGPAEGMLRLEFNRAHDLEDPVSFEEACPSQNIEEENGRIASILMCANNYKKQLPFSAVLEGEERGYNCNSICSAIAKRSGLPLPAFSKITWLCYGVKRPLPEKHLSSGPSGLEGNIR